MTISLTGLTLNGRYHVLGEVGMGKDAIVYKAHDEKLDIPVAIKALKDELPSEHHLQRFHREAETAIALNHENLVRVFDFGTTSDTAPFVVMEYITGLLLSLSIEIEGRLPLPKAIPILSQICDGMAHAHERGIIHRDLRPNNVFLVERPGQAPLVKIVDFGVAKNLRASEEKPLTEEWEVLGTPEFMSPEQIRGLEVDHRTDIYSMGCLMYQVFTGQLPFSGRNNIEVFMQKIQGEPYDISEPSRGRHLPPYIKAAVKQALSKEPGERQNSMLEIKAQLLQVQPAK